MNLDDLITRLEAAVKAKERPADAQPALPIFTGSYCRSVDNKGRVVVPHELRASLGTRVALTRGTGGVLIAMSGETWAQLVLDFDPPDPAFAGYVIGGARLVDLNPSSRRISIPWELREHANIRAGGEAWWSGLGRACVIACQEQYQRRVAGWERALA